MRSVRIALFAIILFLVMCFPWTGNASPAAVSPDGGFLVSAGAVQSVPCNTTVPFTSNKDIS